MKRPKFNIFEHVYDRYGIEYIITDRVLAKDDYIYNFLNYAHIGLCFSDDVWI